MGIDIPSVLHTVLKDYALPLDGYHGIAHWARVLENGCRLASETGADIEVVSLFAVLHDSRRTNEGSDPDHGPRAAELAAGLRGKAFDLPDDAFALLHRACHGHTHELTHPETGGVMAIELFGGPSNASDQLRARLANLSGTISASLAPGAEVEPGDVFDIMIADQILMTDLILSPMGFAGRMDVVTLTSGPDSGKQALRLSVVPEPANAVIEIFGASTSSPLSARKGRPLLRTYDGRVFDQRWQFQNWRARDQLSRRPANPLRTT